MTSSRRPGRPSGPPDPLGAASPADGVYLVSFDISFDPARRAAGKALERFGPKLLYSVYEVAVPEKRLPRLLARLDELIEPSDHALVLPVCDRCAQAWWGLPLDSAPPGGWVAR